MTLNIEFLAGLKDFFGQSITITTNEKSSILDITSKLISEQPQAEALLLASRVCINDEFIENTHQPNENDTLYYLPPASGG